MYEVFYASPIGILKIVCNDNEVVEIRPDLKGEENANAICYQVKQELDSYFNNRIRKFSLPLKLSGTPFQNKVWQELLKISFGEVISYQELANRVGNPKGVRAVANAVGANKLLIVIPCHRIIGTDNSVTGFSAGIKMKIKLLCLEGYKITTKKELRKSAVIL